MATVLLLALRQPQRLMNRVVTLTCAMRVCGGVRCDRIRRWVGVLVVSAVEKLMGLVLTAIAVEMILAGLKRSFLDGGHNARPGLLAVGFGAGGQRDADGVGTDLTLHVRDRLARGRLQLDRVT
jgi:hypothetical protein